MVAPVMKELHKTHSSESDIDSGSTSYVTVSYVSLLRSKVKIHVKIIWYTEVLESFVVDFCGRILEIVIITIFSVHDRGIWGNDLAGEKVWPNSSTRVITPNLQLEECWVPPILVLFLHGLWHGLWAMPMLIPAIKIYRKKNPVPSFPLPVTCGDLVEAQK